MRLHPPLALGTGGVLLVPKHRCGDLEHWCCDLAKSDIFVNLTSILTFQELTTGLSGLGVASSEAQAGHRHRSLSGASMRFSSENPNERCFSGINQFNNGGNTQYTISPVNT